MSAAANITAARIVRWNSEGFRADLYDDATGLPIMSSGQPTIGLGCRCRQWSQSFATAVLGLQLTDAEVPLLQKPWYVSCDSVRQSVLLEIAFNQGVSGFLNGYPLLIAAVTAGDWPDAQSECSVKDVNVKSRYDRLAHILLTGVDE
jgi:GH24 family phage-related lysozyme (muramidase)